LVIAQLYKCCWQTDFISKWIKLNLRIKTLFQPNELGEGR